MTCLVTCHKLNLNSSNYRDSCYVTWFVAVTTHTQFWLNVYGTMVLGLAHQELAIYKLARNIWHSKCLYSRNLWSKSLHQTSLLYLGNKLWSLIGPRDVKQKLMFYGCTARRWHEFYYYTIVIFMYLHCRYAIHRNQWSFPPLVDFQHFVQNSRGFKGKVKNCFSFELFICLLLNYA